MDKYSAKLSGVLLVVVLGVSAALSGAPTARTQAQTTALIIDHRAVEEFDAIPDQYINLAANTKIYFQHSSVGGNVWAALNEIIPVKYPRFKAASATAWTEVRQANDGAQSKMDLFSQAVGGNYDKMILKFGYVDNWEENETPPLSTRYINFMNSLGNSSRYIYISMGLQDGGAGRSVEFSNIFNQAIRQYVTTNQRVLYDLADIESYLWNGSGYTACMSGGYQALCSQYTYSADGGHLILDGNGTLSPGAERAAKAWWVMLAKLAGWGGTSGAPTNTATPTPALANTPTPAPTSAPANTPAPTPAPTSVPANTPAPTPAPTSVPANTPTATATPVGTPASLNLALSGVAYRWRRNTTSTANTNRTATTLLNDGSTVSEVNLNGSGDDVDKAWEAAGVVWSASRPRITRVEFVSGSHDGGPDGNGCFEANFKLQISTDGTTWVDATGWTLAPAYAYNATVSNKTYVFTGIASNVRGVRVTGQVHLSSTGGSWHARAREVRAF